MGTQQNLGIFIMLAALAGLAYFFLYKTPAAVVSGSGGDDPPAPEPVKAIISAEVHEKLAVFELRAEEFRKQISKLTRRSALPRGLKDNIYAFTEDVRQVDSIKADQYYAEFCEGRPELPQTAEFRRSRSRQPGDIPRQPDEAPLNTNLRNNDDSAFRALEPGQFNIRHKGGKRGSGSLESHLSGYATERSQSVEFIAFVSPKEQQLNPHDTQETTATGGLSGFNASPSINNRDNTGIIESTLSGNKQKTYPTVARMKPEKVYVHGKAEVVTHDAFQAFQGLEADNRVNPKKRKIAIAATVIKREAPTIPGPNFQTVAIPQAVLAADDGDKTSVHGYLHQLDLCIVDMSSNYTEGKYNEAKALLALIGDKDPHFNLTRQRMEVETAKAKNSKKARPIQNVYFASELANMEKGQATKRARLGMIRLPALSRGSTRSTSLSPLDLTGAGGT